MSASGDSRNHTSFRGSPMARQEGEAEEGSVERQAMRAPAPVAAAAAASSSSSPSNHHTNQQQEQNTHSSNDTTQVVTTSNSTNTDSNSTNTDTTTQPTSPPLPSKTAALKEIGAQMKETIRITISHLSRDECTRALMKSTEMTLDMYKEKHIERLLAVSEGHYDWSNQSDSNDWLIASLHARLHSVTWITPLKGLLVIHRLLWHGSDVFRAKFAERSQTILDLAGLKMFAQDSNGKVQKPVVDCLAAYCHALSYCFASFPPRNVLEIVHSASNVAPICNQNLNQAFKYARLAVDALNTLVVAQFVPLQAIDNEITIEAFRRLIADGKILYVAITRLMAVAAAKCPENSPGTLRFMELFEEYDGASHKLIEFFSILGTLQIHFGESIPTLQALPSEVLEAVRLRKAKCQSIAPTQSLADFLSKPAETCAVASSSADPESPSSERGAFDSNSTSARDVTTTTSISPSGSTSTTGRRRAGSDAAMYVPPPGSTAEDDEPPLTMTVKRSNGDLSLSKMFKNPQPRNFSLEFNAVFAEDSAHFSDGSIHTGGLSEPASGASSPAHLNSTRRGDDASSNAWTESRGASPRALSKATSISPTPKHADPHASTPDLAANDSVTAAAPEEDEPVDPSTTPPPRAQNMRRVDTEQFLAVDRLGIVNFQHLQPFANVSYHPQPSSLTALRGEESDGNSTGELGSPQHLAAAPPTPAPTPGYQLVTSQMASNSGVSIDLVASSTAAALLVAVTTATAQAEHTSGRATPCANNNPNPLCSRENTMSSVGDLDTTTQHLMERFDIDYTAPIGRGGFGAVYKAFDNDAGLYVAVKQLKLSGGEDEEQEAIRALKAEFDAMCKLNHPNIVSVYALLLDRATSKAQIFMEWVPGGSLYSIMKRIQSHNLKEPVVVRYTRNVLEGLAHLHAHSMLHRDIKPANMLLTTQGEVKLTDFGTARVVQALTKRMNTGTVVGTVAYMAPECLNAGHYSTASDVWGLACSVLEMLTGNPPWHDSNCHDSMALLFFIGSARPPHHHPTIPPIHVDQIPSNTSLSNSATAAAAAAPPSAIAPQPSLPSDSQHSDSLIPQISPLAPAPDPTSPTNSSRTTGGGGKGVGVAVAEAAKPAFETLHMAANSFADSLASPLVLTGEGTKFEEGSSTMTISPEAHDFLEKCFAFAPTDRPTVEELLQHPFVTRY